MSCNFAVTDGRSTVVCRYSRGMDSGTLYSSAGQRYECVEEDGDMLGTGSPAPRVAIVASEPLTRRPEDWRELPPNHVLTIGPDQELELLPIRAVP